MSSSEKELEEKLKDAGNSLLEPPSTTNDLLSLLDVMTHSLLFFLCYVQACTSFGFTCLSEFISTLYV